MPIAVWPCPDQQRLRMPRVTSSPNSREVVHSRFTPCRHLGILTCRVEPRHTHTHTHTHAHTHRHVGTRETGHSATSSAARYLVTTSRQLNHGHGIPGRRCSKHLELGGQSSRLCMQPQRPRAIQVRPNRLIMAWLLGKTLIGKAKDVGMGKGQN